MHTTRLTKACLLLLVQGLLLSLAIAQEPTLYQSAPEDWRAEVIEFPLEFAPSIDLTGVEELRFAPGMFDKDSDTYFTYTFVWWLEGSHHISDKQLSEYMLAYFQGLYKAVSSEQQDVSGFSAEFHSSDDDSYSVGSVNLIDPFSTEENVNLHVLVNQWLCEEQKKSAVFFRFSPSPLGSTNWQAMEKQKAGECTE